MATIPLPALDVKQAPNPLDTYAHIIGIKSMLLQQQGEQQQQEIMGSQLKDIQAGRAILNELASNATDSGKSPTPQDVYRVAGKYGASATAASAIANGMLATQQHVSDIAKNDAATQASQLDTQIKRTDQQRGRLQSIINGPTADKQANWEKEIADAEANGFLKPGTVSNVYPGDEAAQALADHWALGSVLAKEATEKLSATGSYLRGATAANEFAAKQNPQSPLYSPSNAAVAMGTAPGAQQIQAGEAAQAGKVAGAQAAARFPYEKQLEGIRQQVAQTFQNNKDATDKIEATVLKPYEEKMTSIAQLQSAVQQASQGNITAARAVALKLIGVTNPDGTKRYNEAEADRLISQGNLPERVKGSVKNLLTGDNWTDKMQQDMLSFGDAQGQVAADNLNRGIANVNKLYNTNVGTGLLQNPSGQRQPGAGAPQGYTRIKASDGSLHDIPTQNLGAAKQRDPQLQVIQ